MGLAVRIAGDYRRRGIEDDDLRQVAFLAELVKSPTDNPPGDCAAHAALARGLLEDLGFEVEAHPVPQDAVHAAGMKSVTNLIIRHRFGDGPTIALNANGDVVPPGSGWDHDPYGAEIVETADGRRMADGRRTAGRWTADGGRRADGDQTDC